jgi:bifunctional non-homologous end joining protein LigD
VALVRRAALLTRDALGEHGLASAVVATGSKGYHVIVPIVPSVEVETLAHAVRQFATLLAAKHTGALTTAFRIKERGGAVFVDWLRNNPSASVVAPYSLRATPRASVAAPLSWDELERVAPDGFGIDDAAQLLQRDDPLAQLAETPGDAQAFVRDVEEAFTRSGLVLEPFDRFRS